MNFYLISTFLGEYGKITLNFFQYCTLPKTMLKLHKIEKIPFKHLKIWVSFALTRLTKQDLIKRIDKGVYQISNNGLENLNMYSMMGDATKGLDKKEILIKVKDNA